jgi:hypothetical protein
MKLHELRTALRDREGADPNPAGPVCSCCKRVAHDLQDTHEQSAVCAECRSDCYDVLAGRFEHGYGARLDAFEVEQAARTAFMMACKCSACGAARAFEIDERTDIHHVYLCVCGHIESRMSGK